MGTNFYLKKDYHKYTDEYAGHIGKRSAAGLYCWDCNITLCMGGLQGIHFSEYDFYDKCPKCGQGIIKEKLEDSSAGLELGFADRHGIKKKKGVRGCSSFRWAKHPNEVEKSRIKYIYDQYGEKYTKQEFLDSVKNGCPVQYFNIGEYFS